MPFNCVISMFLVINLIFSQTALSQTIIRGVIKDAENSESIVAVSIRDLNSNKSVISNSNGEFEIEIEHLPTKLQVSHISYQTNKIDLKSDSYLKVNLLSRTILLPELVIDNRADQIIANVIRENALNKTNQYYKAFYQKVSLQAGTYTKIHEVFFNVLWSKYGIQRWQPTNSRFAELKKQDFNFSNLFSQSMYFTRTIDSTVNYPLNNYPSSVNTIYKVDKFINTEDGNKIAVIKCEALSETLNSFRGNVFVNMSNYALLRIEGTYQFHQEQYNSITKVVMNYRHSKELGISLFDNSQIEYELTFKDSSQPKFVEKAWLIFIEQIPQREFNSNKSRSPIFYSDIKKIKHIKYDTNFWSKNIPIKHTKLEEEVIKRFERKGQFKSNFN